MKKRTLLTWILVISAVFMTSCGNAKAEQEAQEAANKAEAEALAEAMNEEGIDANIGDHLAEVTGETADAITEAESMVDDLLGDYTGEMDLSGSWQDEISQRATMEVTANDDGSYDILVNWGDSADKTLTWQIHGEYDPAGGMLGYEDAVSYYLVLDDSGKEKMTEQQTSHGAIMKEGDKLRWKDSRGDTECVFVRQ